jgi:hypothetical protein
MQDSMNLACVAAAAMSVLCLAPLPLAAATIKQVAALSDQCSSGKENSCRQLRKIAVGDKSADVRRAAVAKVTEQPLLAQIAMEDLDGGVRRAAADAITDQGLLAKIALESTDPNLQLASISKITDQNVLAKLSLQGNDAEVRLASVAKVADQSTLAKSALEDRDTRVRIAAMSGLVDQALLAKIASDTTDAGIRTAALKRITDRPLLSRVVGEEVRSINWRASNDAVTFAPEVKIAVGRDGFIAPGGFQVGSVRPVAPKDNQSFWIVEIVFQSSRALELAAGDVRLVFPDSQSGEAVGLLGDASFVSSEFRQDTQGNVISAKTFGPYWESPSGDSHQKMLVSGQRTLSWLFIVARNSDPRQYKLSVLGAEFSLDGIRR